METPPLPLLDPLHPETPIASRSRSALAGIKADARRHRAANTLRAESANNAISIPGLRPEKGGRRFSGTDGSAASRDVVEIIREALVLPPTETAPQLAPVGNPEQVKEKVRLDALVTWKVADAPAVTVCLVGEALRDDEVAALERFNTVLPPN